MDKKKELISIILTLYNKASYIEETIFSIYKQTYANRELIIVDDCSTDWSLEIAKSFCEKLWITKKCKFIKNEKNLRVAKTFERWLKEAKWDRISMCDWDDILIKNKLEMNLTYCKNNNIDFCYSDLVGIDENNNILYSSYFKKHPHVNFKKHTFKDFIYRWSYAIWSAIFFSKEIWTNLKSIWLPKDLYQDRWAILYTSVKWYNIWHINTPLVYYRRCSSCISRARDALHNKSNSNTTVLKKIRNQIFKTENCCYKYILEQNIHINNEQKNRCKKHIEINNLLIDFIEWKNIFMKRQIFKLLFNLWESKYYIRVLSIQARKLLTIFSKS